MTRTKAAARLWAVAACAVALVLAGCANPIDAVRASLDMPTAEEALSAQVSSMSPAVSDSALVEPGTLTVGIDAGSSAPMAITDAAGSLTGYDVDIAHALGDELGLAVRFVKVSSPAQDLGTTCDVVMDQRADEARGLSVVGSYAEGATAFFHRGAATTAAKADIQGKVVGVQDGSSSQQLLKRSDLNASQKTYKNLNDAFAALESGEVDYVLCDALSGAYLSASYSDLAIAGTIDAPQAVGVGVASDNEELKNAVASAVDDLSSNGVATIMRSRWLGGLPTLTGQAQVQGVTITAGMVTGSTETTEATGGSAGSQDGSTAGSNAVDIAGAN